MSAPTPDMTHREIELAAIIDAYNAVTERLKISHEQLGAEVSRLREELSRKNRQLRRRERLAALGELAAGVAHEIRNPLGGIRVFASLLRRDLVDQPDSLRLVEKITSGVTRLERIVTDILEFGRPSEPNPEPASIRMLLGEVVELAAGKRPGSCIEVQMASEIEDFQILTDAPMLQRAILNLVLNGLEAGEAGQNGPGRVILRVNTTGDRVAVEVMDNGRGIPAELHDRIFNPFFTTKETGTGLGLAIVHQTIEMLGGTVTAANLPEGGAAFTVNLPKAFHAVASVRQTARNRSGRSTRGTTGTGGLTRNSGANAAA